MVKVAKRLISPFLFKTSLIGFFILVFSLSPQSILAEVLSVTGTIQISTGEEVSGRVEVSSPEDGSCLKAMSAQGPLPNGVTADFTPECGEGNWVSNYQVKADNTAEYGTYQIGFVEIPTAGLPAIDVKQLTLAVMAVSPESPTILKPTSEPSPSAEETISETTATPTLTGGSEFPWPLLFSSLVIFLAILLGLDTLVRRVRQPCLCQCEVKLSGIEAEHRIENTYHFKPRFSTAPRCSGTKYRWRWEARPL